MAKVAHWFGTWRILLESCWHPNDSLLWSRINLSARGAAGGSDVCTAEMTIDRPLGLWTAFILNRLKRRQSLVEAAELAMCQRLWLCWASKAPGSERDGRNVAVSSSLSLNPQRVGHEGGSNASLDSYRHFLRHFVDSGKLRVRQAHDCTARRCRRFGLPSPAPHG